MAIALRGTPVGSNNGGGATTTVVTFPAGHTTGDVLVFALTVRGGTGVTYTTPGGWSAVAAQTNSTTVLAQKVFAIVDTGSLGSSVTVTHTSGKASAVCYAFSGAEAAIPAAAQYSGQANASSMTIASAARSSWTSCNGIDINFTGMAYGGNTVGSPASYSAGANSSSTGGSAASRTQTHGSDRALSAVTTVGALSETWTGTAGVNIGTPVFIKEAVVKSATDAGVGSDAGAVVTQAYASTESGAGSDTTSSLAAAITGTADAGVGSDAGASISLATRTDAGTGADTAALAVILNASAEAAVGSDAGASIALATTADAGVGSDAGAGVQVAMAFGITTSQGAFIATSGTITFPTGGASGDRIVICLQTAQPVSSWGGATQIAATGPFNGNYLYSAHFVATGAGGSLTYTPAGYTNVYWICYRITGAHTSSAPEAATTAWTTGTNPDPPNLTPSWGSAANLWIVHCYDGNGVTAPTNYTNLITQSAVLNSARREVTGASEDPGVFTAASSDNSAHTIAVRPGSYTAKSGTEAAVGSDTSAGISLATTDAGTGSDAGATVDQGTADKTATDAGAGADTSLPVDRLLATTADSGAGTDTGAAITLGTTTDAGVGADANAAVTVPVLATEAGAGADTSLPVDRLLATTTEAGAGGDAGAAVDRLLATTTDSGAGSDAASVDTGTTAKSASDSGVGADVMASIGPTVSDTGAGAESVSGRGIGTSDGSAGSAIIGNAPVLFDAETGDVFISLGGVLIAKTS